MSSQMSLFGWQYQNPITDIQFVCSLDKVPSGYVALQHCPNGYTGQLWQNKSGKEPETRYICYTKENVCQDYVIEGMYIPSPNEPLLKKGYQVIGFTVEGEKPMRIHQLAIKKAPISKASKIIVEIVLFRTEDVQTVPRSYKKLEAVNGIHIHYREFPPPTKPSVVPRSLSEKLSGSDSSDNSSEDPLPKKPPPVSTALLPDQGRDAATTTGASASPQPTSVRDVAHQMKLETCSKAQARQLRLKEKSRFMKNRRLQDHAVTDIVFVCSLDNVPPGYQVIDQCASGHSAQLWDTSSAGRPGTRYLCYTKEKQDGNLVIENMYIPWPGESLRQGFRPIKHTLEGEVPMSQYKLTIQKVPLTQAARVVVDIIICRQKEVKFVPSSYNRLYNINDLRITFRTAPNIFYEPTSVSSQPQLEAKGIPASRSAHKATTNTSSYPPLRMPTSLQTAIPLNPNEKMYFKDFLVHPITDVVLVQSLENVPMGYTPIPHCVSTHSAQLWKQRAFKDRSETRYLCYTKEKQSDDQLIQDLYVLRPSQKPMSGYSIITATVEGEKALKHKKLAVKKLPRAVATAMVIDIMMCRKQDRHLVPQEYITLESINDVHINFMVALMKDLRTMKR